MDLNSKSVQTPWQDVILNLRNLNEAKCSFLWWISPPVRNELLCIEALLKLHLRVKCRFEIIRFSDSYFDVHEGCKNEMQDPWHKKIIPYTKKIKPVKEEQIVILILAKIYSREHKEMFIRELVRFVDDHSHDVKYPIIFLLPEELLTIFLSNNEATMTNWGGFLGRVSRYII